MLIGSPTTTILTRGAFKADRPLLLAIRDDETEALLFIGSIAEPARAQCAIEIVLNI